MKLVHVTSRYFPWFGGSEIFVREIIRRTRESEHMVITTTARTVEETFVPNGLPSSKELVDGTPVERYRCIRPVGLWTVARILDRTLRFYAYGPNSPGQLASLMKSDYDLIHACPFVGTHNLYAYAAAKIRSRRIIFTPFIHTADIYHFDRHYLFHMLRNAFRVNAMTEHEKRYIIRHGIAPSKVFVTGMGIDPLEFDCVEKTIDPDRGRFKALVCFVGRLDPAKGIYELIEVVSKMKGICLKIVGEEVGEFRKHYDTLAPSLRERIQYLGCLPFNETASIIARSDIFCLPSRVESFGHVYLEAMYFGKPVIAWNLEAVKEVVADAGLFVASKTQLESAIRTLVEDENLRDDISYRGRAIVRDRFNWTRIAQIFAENALQS